MSAELQEFHSYAYFKRIVPRNPIDWEGRVILYAAISEKFFRISFGTGDNLTDDDTDEGFDDYIMASPTISPSVLYPSSSYWSAMM